MSASVKSNSRKSLTVKRGSTRSRSARKRTFVSARFREPAPAWETNLENNLVEEGFSRAKARRLVRLAAS